MNREQLRSEIIDGDNKIMNSVAWRFMNDEQRKLLTIGLQFWQTDSNVTNAALDDMVNRYNLTKRTSHVTQYYKTSSARLGLFGRLCNLLHRFRLWF